MSIMQGHQSEIVLRQDASGSPSVQPHEAVAAVAAKEIEPASTFVRRALLAAIREHGVEPASHGDTGELKPRRGLPSGP